MLGRHSNYFLLLLRIVKFEVDVVEIMECDDNNNQENTASEGSKNSYIVNV